MYKKVPPYGKPLAELQQKNLKPTDSVYVWIGKKAWQKGESFSRSMPTRTLVVPAWHPPSNYIYPVKDCDMLIYDTGFAELDYVNELAHCLYDDGAKIVRYVDVNFKLTVFHRE